MQLSTLGILGGSLDPMGLLAAGTLALSIYGAGLASYVAVRGAKRDRKAVVVRCGFGYQAGTGAFGDPVAVITIEATNIGVRPIEVHGAGFVRAEDGEEVERTPYVVHPSPPPIVLADGASVRFSYRTISDAAAAESFEVEKVYVRTSPDERWFGEPDAWLKPLRVTRKWWGP